MIFMLTKMWTKLGSVSTGLVVCLEVYMKMSMGSLARLWLCRGLQLKPAALTHKLRYICNMPPQVLLNNAAAVWICFVLVVRIRLM